jgi:hypothetical protein
VGWRFPPPSESKIVGLEDSRDLRVEIAFEQPAPPRPNDTSGASTQSRTSRDTTND